MRTALSIAVLVGLTACCGKKNAAGGSTTTTGDAAGASSPRVLVYRTKIDHADHVPVLLSADHTRIISYPAPTDLKTANGLPVPTPVGQGYLLDNRGISRDVAYLGITWAEYAALPEAPALEKLDALIIDRDPLTELWEGDRRANIADPVKEVSAWVAAGELEKHCKRLK